MSVFVGMTDATMNKFLLDAFNVDSCDFTAQQLFDNAKKGGAMWKTVREELGLTAARGLDLQGVLMDARGRVLAAT